MTQGDPEDNSGRPTVRDKRRIDPQTYELRDPDSTSESGAAPQQAEGAETGTPADAAAGSGPAAGSAELDEVKGQLADRTADLQRVQAEYVNYKRRVDRDRDLSRKAGVEQVLTELMPVLDGLQTAREHEELSGGFKAFADEITKIATKYGLESFGEAGDPFDPRIHDALMHAQGEGLTGPTCVTILQPGYRIGDRILRPARVAVAEPDEAVAGDPPAAADGVSDQPVPDQGSADQTGDQGAAGSQQ